MGYSVSDQQEQLSRNIFSVQSSSGRGTFEIRKSPIEIQKIQVPTSDLTKDPFQFSSISYPKDVTQDMQNGHYMLFYINVQNKTKYKMEPYGQEPGVKIGEIVETKKPGYEGEVLGQTTSEFVSYGDTEATYRKGLVNKGGTGIIHTSDGVDLRKGRKAQTGLGSILSTTTRITDSIAIYLPPNVEDATTAGYNNEAEMGIAGAAAVTAGAMAGAVRRKDFVGAIKGVANAGKDLLAQAGLNLGARVLGELGELASGVDSEDLKSLANKAFGRATNPYMEVLFDKVGMRTFGYNFTFSPRNEDETADVQKIIKMFRFHMMPELRGSNAIFLTLPSTFDIHYMYQIGDVDQKGTNIATENNFYTKIATCVLTDCTVNYTPNGVKSFASGAPTQITMNLSFMETEQLTKQHVDQGY